MPPLHASSFSVHTKMQPWFYFQRWINNLLFAVETRWWKVHFPLFPVQHIFSVSSSQPQRSRAWVMWGISVFVMMTHPHTHTLCVTSSDLHLSNRDACLRFPNNQRGNLLHQGARCDIMPDLQRVNQKNITELPLTNETIRYDCENVCYAPQSPEIWASPACGGM